MSLFDETLEDCVIIDKVTTNVNDGYGGVNTSYVDGATFGASFDFDDSTAARIASKDGYIDRHTIYTTKNVELREGDHIKRVRDGKIFKITSNGKDVQTPPSAGLNLSTVTAEEVKGLPNYG